MRRKRSALALARVLVGGRKFRPIATVALGSLVSVLSLLSLISRAQQQGVGLSEVSLGDAVLWLFAGHPTALMPLWAAAWVFVLADASPDARALIGTSTAGSLAQGGTRARGWAACCCAAVGCALLAILSLLAGTALCAFLAGCEPSVEPSSLWRLAPFPIGTAGASETVAFVALLVLGAASLALLELTVGLMAGAAFGFLLVTALVVGAFAFPEVPLPGSWLMLGHVEPFVMGEPGLFGAWHMTVGALVFLLMGVSSALLGARHFSSVDLGMGGAQ